MRTIVSILCIAAVLVSCNHGEHNEHAESTFQVTNPIVADTVIYKEFVCQIQSIQHIELRAHEKGYLQNIYVDEGQFVKKDQLLFQIMPTVYQAEVQKSQAELSYAEIEYQNTKALADSNVISKSELALAKATYEKAKAELSLAQAHLNFTEIRAPFDGIVGRFNDVRLGSLINEEDLLTTLSDNSKMWVYFNVQEVEYLNFITQPDSDEKLKVKLQLANHKLFDEDGIVETIEADFNNETGNIAFRATFDNPKGILRNEETGNILMPVHLNNSLLIPQKATYQVLDKRFVYVINEKNIVEAKEIKVGAEMNHLFEVQAGITKKDKVLIEGLRKVKNGQQIKYVLVDFNNVTAELNQLHAE